MRDQKQRQQYLENLLNHLINKNHYEEFFSKMHSSKVVEYIKIDLEAGDVNKMSPAKLGEIMCSFEIGDVFAGKKELFDEIHFSGDCEEMLRELVSACLAFAIKGKLLDHGRSK